MSITDNLIADEQVVFRSEKHWLAPIRDSVWAAVMIVVAFLLGWISPDSSGGLFGAVGRLLDLVRTVLFIGGIGWIVYNIIVWRTAEFGVTTFRVLRYEGLIQRRASETLLSAISDVRLDVGLVGKALGYGDLRILTYSGEAGADRFATITRAGEFRNAMMTEKMKDERSARASAGPQPAAPAQAASVETARPDADPAQLLTQLATLRDQGIITPEEFEAKKTELLGRI
jgi:uncharacterized membrane protein YdbT with pleckstrin-like domain